MVGDHHIVTKNPRKKIAGEWWHCHNEYSIQRKRVMVEGRGNRKHETDQSQ